MRLSSLQKYILLKALDQKAGKFSRKSLLKFYDDQYHPKPEQARFGARKTKSEHRIKIITRSLERMIDKELLIGYGTRTPHKWYVKEIKLTVKGRKIAKKLLGEQQILPFKVKNKKSKGKSTT